MFLIARYRRMSGSALTASTAQYHPQQGRQLTRMDPSTALTRMHPRPPDNTSPDAPGPERRSCDAGPGGQLAETPDGRLCQATSCIVFAALRHRSQRAFIDEDVACDMPGRRGVAGIQQRLPVQRDGIMPVDLLAAGRAYAGGTTSRTGLTQTRHPELRASQRRCNQQAPSATEVRSDYLTLPRARPRPRASTDQAPCLPARIR